MGKCVQELDYLMPNKNRVSATQNQEVDLFQLQVCQNCNTALVRSRTMAINELQYWGWYLQLRMEHHIGMTSQAKCRSIHYYDTVRGLEEYSVFNSNSRR